MLEKDKLQEQGNTSNTQFLSLNGTSSQETDSDLAKDIGLRSDDSGDKQFWIEMVDVNTASPESGETKTFTTSEQTSDAEEDEPPILTERINENEDTFPSKETSVTAEITDTSSTESALSTDNLPIIQETSPDGDILTTEIPPVTQETSLTDEEISVKQEPTEEIRANEYVSVPIEPGEGEEAPAEDENLKKIESLEAILKEERAAHEAEIKEMKKEILSLSPLPNFEREMLDEIISLREGYFRMKRHYESKNDEFFTKEKVLDMIDDIAIQLETILFNYSVEMSHSDVNDRYNPRVHQAIKIIPTDETEKNGLIEKSLGDLYIYQGRTLQKEYVQVYKLKKKS